MEWCIWFSGKVTLSTSYDTIFVGKRFTVECTGINLGDLVETDLRQKATMLCLI